MPKHIFSMFWVVTDGWIFPVDLTEMSWWWHSRACPICYLEPVVSMSYWRCLIWTAIEVYCGSIPNRCIVRFVQCKSKMGHRLSSVSFSMIVPFCMVSLLCMGFGLWCAVRGPDLQNTLVLELQLHAGGLVSHRSQHFLNGTYSSSV